MGKYGLAAVMAVKLLEDKLADSPNEAWDKATIEMFGRGNSNQAKACPKNTFLGLCQEGIIKGVSPGEYTRSYINKSYALKAVELLKDKPYLVNNQTLLWQTVMNGMKKKHNCQMEVVISLWKEKLIKD